MGSCTHGGCTNPSRARGLCVKHYMAWLQHRDTTIVPGPSQNDRKPIVCECPRPDARPDRAFGECMICHRKPIALFSPENQAIARAAGITWAPMPEFQS